MEAVKAPDTKPEISVNRNAPVEAGPVSVFSSIVSYLLSLTLRLINLTLRWEKIGLDVDGKHWSLHPPMILVFWHGDQLMMPWAYRSKSLHTGSNQLHALVSKHADGRMAARALEHLGIYTVDGSSTRGALRALLMMKQRVSESHHIAITPDGPKGPNRIAKQGAVLLSSSCEIPLFPVTIAVKKAWVLKSWDGMFIPKPFSKAVMIADKPYIVPKNLSKDALALESSLLMDRLNLLKIKAENILNSYQS